MTSNNKGDKEKKAIIILLLKFVQKKYLKETQSGNLWFASVNWLRNHQDDYKIEGAGGIGDTNEGSDVYILPSSVLYFKNPKNSKIMHVRVKNPRLTFNVTKSYGVCSFMWFGIKDFEKTKEEKFNVNDKTVKRTIFKLADQAILQIKQFQKIETRNKHEECLPLIFNPVKFFPIVEDKNNHIGFGPVEYRDFSEIGILPPDYSKISDASVLFKKDQRFSNEHEFRLVKYIPKNVKGQVFEYKQLESKILKLNQLKDLRIGVPNNFLKNLA